MVSQAFSVVYVITVLPVFTPAQNSIYDSGLQEVCDDQTVSAQCAGPDNVIVMQWAFYGRRRLGECIKTDYGSLGCGTNVLKDVDLRCSGRPSCTFEIDELNDDDCPQELKPALEYQYQCWPVITTPDIHCRPDHAINLRQKSGYLSSYTTAERDHGSPACPWLITVEPGQKINITLINFVWTVGECFKFAVIKEGGTAEDFIACEGRLGEPYISQTSTVELQIETHPNRHFLFHYSPLGCADPTVGPNLWLRRQGDVATVTCNHTGETWPLQCRNREWKGTTGNCTPSQSILIIVAIGVALGVFLGGLLLVCVSRYFKRRRRMGQFSDTDDYQPDLFPGASERGKFGADPEQSLKTLRQSPTSPHYEGTLCRFSTIPEHSCKDCQCPFGYGSLPSSGLHHSVGGTNPTMPRHMYESPSSDQQRRITNS